jgi:hypothetical protein
MGAVDRRKHDVDIIERVVGGVRDRLQDEGVPTHVVDVGPSSGADHSTLELTVGVAEDRLRPGTEASDRPPQRRRS